jgi:hypothetical protein
MRKFLLSGAALLAVAAPSVAAADTAAIGGHYGNASVSATDLDLYGFDLGYSHEFSNNWTIQADGVSDRVDSSGFEAGLGYAAVAFGMRSEGHALYGFVGHADLLGESAITLGVGGQLYFGHATLNGSVGYDDFDGASITNASVDGTWFVSDNFGVNALASYGEADVSGSPDWTTLGIGGVWRFTGSPVAVDFGYRNVDASGSDIDVWRIGFTINIGTDTARAQSQSGPSFNGARRLYEDSLWIF